MADFDPDKFLAEHAAPVPSTPAVPAPSDAPPAFDPDAFLAAHHDTLASDQSYDPVSAYAKNPSDEALTEAREVFKRRAKQPIDYGKAAGDFVKGALPAVGQGVVSMAKGEAGIAANVFTGDLNPFASKPDQDRAERENAAALQLGALHGGDFVTGLGRNIGRLFGRTDKTLTDEQVEQRIKDDAAQRSAEEDLAKGEVGSGAGFSRVSDSTSPEELAAQGSPIRSDRIENMSFIGDPTTYATEGLAHLAAPVLSKFVTAPILKGAGKALELTGKATRGIKAGTAALPAVGWLMHSRNPMQSGAIFSAEMAAKHLAPPAGELLSEAGAEAAGAAPPVGQSLIRKAAKGAATGAVTGATLGIPFAAAAQSPEEAGQAIGGGFGIGGALGAVGGVTGSKATDMKAKAAQLADEGARMNYGLGWEDDAHALAMKYAKPEVRDLVNIYRGRFNGMTGPDGMPIQIYALSSGDYARALAENGKAGGENTAGFVSPDGTKAFINADIANQGGVSRTLGHEGGGHITEFLADIAQRHDISTLRQTIKDAAYNPDGTPKPIFQKFIDRYKSDLAKGGVDPAAVDKLSPDYLEKEWLAEHAGKILNGRAISDFNLPKPIQNILLDGMNRWLEQNGITRKSRGGREGLKFDGTEIKEITRQMSDLLYKQGQQSEALRLRRADGEQPSPSIARRMAELQQMLSKPIDPASTLEEKTARDAAQKELDSLTKSVAPPSPEPNIQTPFGATRPQTAERPPIPVSPPEPLPRQPLPSEGQRPPVSDRSPIKISNVPRGTTETNAHKFAKSDATEGLRQLFKGNGGLNKTDAAKLVDQAAEKIGKSEDSGELLKAALQINSGLAPGAKDPAPISPTTTTNAPPTSPVPTVPPEPAQEPSKQPVVATLPKPAQEPQAAPTRETLKALAKDAGDAAEAAVRAARTPKQKPQTLAPEIKKARDKAELEAMAKAHGAALPADSDLVRMQTDRFGRTGIYGDRIEPSDPFHQELLERAGYGARENAMLRKIKSFFGKPTGVEYLSAPDEPKAQAELDKLSPREQIRELRRRAQAENTAGARAAGEAPVRRAAKSFIPQSITFNPGSNAFTVEGFSPDKFLSNASKVIPWLKAKGIDTYSGVNDPQLIEDLNGYSENHKNGWRGDGSAPVVPSILTGSEPAAGYEPHAIPKDRFDTLNALIGDQSATLVNEKGEPRKGSAEDKTSRAEKQVMAKSNSPFLDPDTGEVNRIRDLMKKEGDFTFENAKGEKFSGPKVLEQASESIRPDLIEKIGDPDDAKDVHKLRPSGVEAKVISAITGTPRSDFAAAGFSPSDTGERLTPERMMVNIRNNGPHRVSTKPTKDYREAISAHLGGMEQGSGSEISAQPSEDEQSKAIVRWADENGVAIRRRPWTLNPTSPNNKGGAEHDVFFDKPSQQVIKTTKLGQYGMWPQIRDIPTTRDGPTEKEWTLSRATPEQYVQRLDGIEKLFGIKTPIHGVIVEPTVGGKMLPSLVTSQPDIQGETVPESEIEKELKNKGFLKISDDSASYYRPEDNTAVLDAHSGNMVRDGDGRLRGYDTIVMEPDGELRQLFERDHAKAAARTAAPKSKRSLPSFAETMGETPEKHAAGFSPEDTGAPEEGGTPGERLAREAEAAGVVLKLDEFKGLMTMQRETVDRIRRRIEQNTGKPAKFSPEGQSESSSPSTRKPSRFTIAAQQRKKERETSGN